MHFLKAHLKGLRIIEALPKLTVAILATRLKIEPRVIAGYRRLEDGVFAREKILDALCEQAGIFIYQKDLHRLSEHLATFDAFICAYTALLADTKQTRAVPRGFPEDTGWIQYPEQGV
jgi:DNA polymerase III epsilon subunit-like protein